MSIEVIEPIMGNQTDPGPFVMVTYDATTKDAKVTLGGGYNHGSRLSAVVVLEMAIAQLKGKTP